VYKVFSYFKREADVICVCVCVCIHIIIRNINLVCMHLFGTPCICLGLQIFVISYPPPHVYNVLQKGKVLPELCKAHHHENEWVPITFNLGTTWRWVASNEWNMLGNVDYARRNRSGAFAKIWPLRKAPMMWVVWDKWPLHGRDVWLDDGIITEDSPRSCADGWVKTDGPKYMAKLRRAFLSFYFWTRPKYNFQILFQDVTPSLNNS
jgi:hypothetical protein